MPDHSASTLICDRGSLRKCSRQILCFAHRYGGGTPLPEMWGNRADTCHPSNREASGHAGSRLPELQSLVADGRRRPSDRAEAARAEAPTVSVPEVPWVRSSQERGRTGVGEEYRSFLPRLSPHLDCHQTLLTRRPLKRDVGGASRGAGTQVYSTGQRNTIMICTV